MDCSLAVLVSWKRPRSVPLVIAAVRAQTVPVHLCLCTCNQHEPEFALSQEVISAADSEFRIGSPNIGPIARLMPCLSPRYKNFEHVIWFVDDHLPGPKFAETLLTQADKLQGRFATLGMQGRNVKGEILMPRPVRSGPCDVITTSELCRTEHLSHALAFRAELLRENPTVSLFEDDLILCMGIQKATGYPSYVVPPETEEQSWRKKRLDDSHALCARPNHRELRDEFVRTAIKVGWNCKR